MHEAPLTLAVHKLAESIMGLGVAVTNLTSLERLEHKVDTMAQRIQDWADQQDADLGGIRDTLNNVAAAIVRLDKQIADLQASPDRITDADQKRLDTIQATIQSLKPLADALRVDAEDGQGGGPEARPANS